MIIKPEVQPSAALSEGDGGERAWDLGTAPAARTTARAVSGLYEARAHDDDDDDDDDLSFQNAEELDEAQPVAPVALASTAGREELRLDVDGPYPQQIASGVVALGLQRVHWIASLAPAGSNRWTGTIFYKDGPVAAFPYTTVRVRVSRGEDASDTAARVRFRAPGGLNRTRRFRYKSRYFHEVDFEFDAAAGEAATTEIDTCAHPNRPPALPCERLTIRKVFRRAGFDVHESPGGTVPIVGAGADTRWSDAEMHDAMLVFWSRFSATAQWAMWVFFASLHEQGTGLGGIMFDDIPPHHRQGTAIFNDAFISVPPAGDPNPAAWVQRMIFWTACHEMGHAFNLAHSWQKSLGTPWVPGLADEPEARSFMNYPFRVSGGQAAFFANFGYRFSNGELLFMRHAPERFVQMGNADWFDHHGFQEARVSPQPTLRLDLRVNRETGVFEFLEPVTLELKLTNVSTDPQIVNASILSSLEAMTVVIKPQGKPAREFRPFGRYCYLPEKVVLNPGESIYAPLGVSAGLNGWDIAEPGRYMVQVALRRKEEDLVSNALSLRVAPPLDSEEELIAQELFTEDVGRVLTVRGTEVLSHANGVLHDVVERLSDRRVAIHAAMVLGLPASRTYKVLTPAPAAPAGMEIAARPSKPEEARELLEQALVSRPQDAAETLGHVTYRRQTDAVSEWLAEAGDPEGAAAVEGVTHETLSTRKVHDRSVLGSVLDEVARKRDQYQASAKPTRKKAAR
jgi:hypothetical protein